MGTIISVLSGKGGTGKTSFCANVGTALCALGEKVLLIDTDSGLRNLDLVLGLESALVFSFADVIDGVASLKEASGPHPVIKNMRVLTAPGLLDSGGLSRFNKNQLEDFFQKCRDNFSYILIDCAAGLEADILTFSALADRAVIVTSTDPAALRIASSATRALSALGQNNCRIALNRVQKKLIKKGAALSIDESIDTAGVPLTGVIPEDRDVLICGGRGQPLLLNSLGPAQAAYMNIARRLQGKRVPLLSNIKRI